MLHPANEDKDLEKRAAALARIFMVCMIQTIGVGLTLGLAGLGPFRLFRIPGLAPWQFDCLVIGGVLVLSLLILWPTFGCTYFWDWRASIPEGVIRFIYGLNIVAFSVAMARTGVPSQSFFGQLVPMQLTGMLLLEHQRSVILNSKRTSPWGFAAFAVCCWLAVVVLKVQVGRLFGRNEMVVETDFQSYEHFAATVLFILGIVVTAAAYWITDRPSFIARFRPRA